MAKEETSPDETIDSTEDMAHEEHKKSVHHEHHEHMHHKHAEHEAHEEHMHKKSCGPCKCNTWMIASIVLFVAAILFMVLWLTKGNGADENLVKEEMTQFINANLLQQGMTSSIDSIKEVNGVYELTVTVQGQTITSYASKDGKIFFPSGYALEDVAAATTDNTQTQQTETTVPKTDKPVVEVFVMAYCPYGTQIEKGMLPVVDLLGDKADIQVKFVNYAMHGQKEVSEQLTQYCVQQEYSDKYYKYLQCFLADGNSSRCMTEIGLDQTKINSCVAATDAKFGISKDYADKTTWMGSYPSFSIYDAENSKYGVQGSPTLVINGVAVSSARDSESLKSAVCAAFNNAPAECKTTLSTASPSAGFGFGTSGTDAAAAGCGV